MLEKIQVTRRMLRERKADCELEVDGGIDVETAPLAVAAGARVLVAGTSIFDHHGGAEEGLRDLGQAVAGTVPGFFPLLPVGRKAERPGKAAEKGSPGYRE